VSVTPSIYLPFLSSSLEKERNTTQHNTQQTLCISLKKKAFVAFEYGRSVI
jgi:hypothetical protein